MMIELEESILSQFGLPPQAFYFSEILQQEGHSLMNIGHRAEALYDRLIEEANAYLLSPPPRDINVLMCAKETMANSQEVLPFIGFQTTIYTNFLYYDIYMPGLCDELQLLHYLKQAGEYYIPDKRIIPIDFNEFNKAKNRKAMEKFKLPFFEKYGEYLFYLMYTEQRDNANEEITLGADMQPSENYLELETFFITHVSIKNVAHCSIEVIYESNGEYRMIYILCHEHMLKNILSYAAYYSIASALAVNLITFNFERYPFKYDTLQVLGKYIEISKCRMLLEQFVTLEEDCIDDNTHFTINSICPLTDKNDLN
ncbi:MAG: hypothetical protein IPG85_07285 [Bacteroidetes bacterium]|nr:hypothetical protein [Bacteroidota bacterium]